jgi:preprotein translocase subunit SecG
MLTTTTICSGLFFLIGLGLAFAGFRTYQKSNQASNWMTTTGRITTSAVTNRMSSDHKQYAHIEYEYSVLGANYVSNKINFAQLIGFDNTAMGNAEETVKKFPAGSAVTVYYDPQDPHRAVIEKGGDAGMLILGGLFMAAALVFYFLQYK